MQAPGDVQMVLREVVKQHSPQAYSDAPRGRIDAATELIVEPATAAHAVFSFHEQGHALRVMHKSNSDFGSAQLVERLLSSIAQASAYVAGSDHRRDRLAIAH